ncbi:MAG: cupredoxin domain-containing protein [Actinomycetes bacterium]
MRRSLTPTASALLALLVAACGAPDDGAPGAQDGTPPAAVTETDEAPAEELVITISDFAFDVPATVPPGAEVTVVNEDSSFHTVTAADGAFDVDAPGGETVTFTAPEEPGEYAFSCTPHPRMTATLTVE